MRSVVWVVALALECGLAACGPDVVADITSTRDGGAMDGPRADGEPPGACCPAGALCRDACCAAGQVCQLGRCVVGCPDDAVRCGGEGGVCCGGEETCEDGGCVAWGAGCTAAADCRAGTYCETTRSRCLPDSARDPTCSVRPLMDPFALVEEWSWTGDADVLPDLRHVVMTPAVVSLDDDNGDGVVDQRDIPDIVFSTHGGRRAATDPVLRAISGRGGSRMWPTTDPGYRVSASGQVAVAELVPSSPGPEIVACTPGDADLATAGHLLLVAADGTLLRRFDTPGADVPCDSDAPAIGDMDGDGVPEIAVRHIIARADGTVVARIREERSRSGVYTALADVDGDEDLELVSTSGAYEMDGTPLWERVVDAPGRPALGFGYLAVGDLDLDAVPELVVVTLADHSVRALSAATGDTIWGPVDINPSELADVIAADATGPRGGGPPTLSNLDDDPNPEIAVAGGFAYVAFEHTGARKWWAATSDRSSRSTGSSIFDFEGDGVAEALYGDERTFRVYRGADGAVLLDICNTSTTQREYPLVADVDGDNQAEIVLVQNNNAVRLCADGTPSGNGIRVLGHPSGRWARTRPIWNQHTYHVTNIETDATVPRRERRHWVEPGLNAFRQNVLPTGQFDAPDIVLEGLQVSTCGCPTELVPAVRVVNRGSAGVRPGIPVVFYSIGSGSRTIAGRGVTMRALLPGAEETVVMEEPYLVPAGREGDLFRFEASANDPVDPGFAPLAECRDINNAAGPVSVVCP